MITMWAPSLDAELAYRAEEIRAAATPRAGRRRQDALRSQPPVDRRTGRLRSRTRCSPELLELAEATAGRGPAKLGVSGRTEAVMVAHRRGLLPTGTG